MKDSCLISKHLTNDDLNNLYTKSEQKYRKYNVIFNFSLDMLLKSRHIQIMNTILVTESVSYLEI